MKIYDITVPLQNGIPCWPGDEEPKIELYAALSRGDIVNCSRIQCSLHTGTHVDAPRHLFKNGASVDQLSPDILMGTVVVIDTGEVPEIDASTLREYSWNGIPRVLFKTRNSAWWQAPRHTFRPEYVSLTADGAQYLVDKGVQLVGIDYLSIDLFDNTELPAHKILLSNNVVVIENLVLREVPPGKYELICLPLNIVGGDGAPARVILRTTKG